MAAEVCNLSKNSEPWMENENLTYLQVLEILAKTLLRMHYLQQPIPLRA
jgi:hypothetical protein